MSATLLVVGRCVGGHGAAFVAAVSGRVPVQLVRVCRSGLRGEWLGSGRRRWRCERERVDHERVAEQVEVLAGVADAVGAAEPEGVVEVAVDGLGVVAARVEPLEVGVAGRDGPEVLGAVELAGGVVVVAVEPDGDGLVAVAVGELVVVVPAVAAVLVRGCGGCGRGGARSKCRSPVSVSSPMPSAPPSA